MRKLGLEDLNLEGRRVFMRVDFNVPMSEGSITDDSRITAALPSIRHVMDAGGRLVLASHLGRPKGKPEPRFSLRPVASHLAGLLGREVRFAADCAGPETEAEVAALPPGGVILLENLRFHKGEEENDPEFSAALARLADVYVNDAFGSAHRAHASTAGITEYVAAAAAGFLMQKEIESLGRTLENPERPYASIVGGAKISGKIELVEHFLTLADDILIGGAMAYTFLRAQGQPTGRSLVEEDKIELARSLLGTAKDRGKRLLLPSDHVVARDLDGAGVRTVDIAGTAPEEIGLDIGPRTIEAYGRVIRAARTIVWNGPMGMFENPRFAEGTMEIGRAVADSDAFSVVGGGDSAAAAHQGGFADRIDHISTGGGAALEFLSGRKLPGVEALTDKGDGDNE